MTWTRSVLPRCIGDLIKAGAGIVGGCCGTTPEYIRAVHKILGR